TSGASSANGSPPNAPKWRRLPEPAAAPAAGDRRQELAKDVGVDRLLQVMVDAGEGVGDALVVVLPPGDGDQDDVVAVALAQGPRQLVAVHPRHADVEQ